MTNRPNHPRRLPAALLAAALALSSAGPALADTLWLRRGETGNALPRQNMKVLRIEDGQLYFSAADSGEEADPRPLHEVVRIEADDEPALNEAEEAFDKEDWKTAVDAYQRAISTTGADWVKTRAGLRLIAASANAGDFAGAVAGYASLMTRDPALAADYQPEIPSGTDDAALKTAIAEIEGALQAGVQGDAEQALQTYLSRLYRAAGENEKAAAVLEKLSGSGDAATAGGGGDEVDSDAAAAQAEVKLQSALVALEQQDYQKVVQEIESGSALFTKPAQQLEALYALAEARAGLAGEDVDALTEAALTYMKVVAFFKDGDSPRVPASLVKAAGILEKLQYYEDALKLYEQTTKNYKDSDVAGEAGEGAKRVQEKLKEG